MELVNLVLLSLRTKRTDAEFDKFWNQLISEVSQLDVEEPSPNALMSLLPIISTKYQKIYIAGHILKHMIM